MCAGDPETKETQTCHPYFTDKETEAERLHSLCVIAKILALVCAQSACLSPTSRLGIQEGLRKKHLSLTLCMDEPHPQLLGVMRATLCPAHSWQTLPWKRKPDTGHLELHFSGLEAGKDQQLQCEVLYQLLLLGEGDSSRIDTLSSWAFCRLRQ